MGAVPPSSPYVTVGEEVPLIVALTMLFASLMAALFSSRVCNWMVSWNVLAGQPMHEVVAIGTTAGVPVVLVVCH